MLIGDNYFTIPVFNDLSVTTLYFLMFCFIVFTLTVPFKYTLRPYVLLIANIFFIYTFGISNLIYLLSFALIGYSFSFLIKKYNKNPIALLLLLPIIGGLLIFKILSQTTSIILPLGISFYTFKILSYLIDVYEEKIDLETNIIYYLDYVTFFPCISAGPINRAKDFLKELKTKHAFDYSDVGTGFLLVAVGLFEKKVFCDFIASVVERSLGNNELLGLNVLMGVLLYSLQIYLDFDAYSNIAIGVSRMLGFKLNKNFNSPYLSTSLKSFWSGWHISLTSWFKDYVYIPLGGSKKGTLRKCINIIVVFLVSALWHGMSITFIIWGLGHGLIRIIEDGLSFVFKKLHISKYLKILSTPILVGINFMIVSMLWVFFRSGNIQTAVDIFTRLFKEGSFDYTLIGMTYNELIWTIVIVVTILITDIIRKLCPIAEVLGKRVFLLRWVVYASMIVIFMIFGMYGGTYDANDFIYRWF